jgi:cellulose synthase/poly-beta-1,6-N-acetylglucosamine synthase-like glycosyltransferase
MVITGLSTYGLLLYRRRVRQRLDVPPGSDVVVIVPVRGRPGAPDGVRRFVAECLAQQGISFRVVFAVESLHDPAAATLAEVAATVPNVTLLVAGPATQRGQKVHNQLAALATLTASDRFVVFADADVELPADWLAQLLRPLLLGHAQVASGYRWIVPEDGHLASRLCALLDWGIATAPRDRRWNLCWGGSMAVAAAALARIDLPSAWEHTLLDDIVLTRAARRAGMVVHAPHRVLVPSPVRHDFRSLFEFGRRQYLLVRVHAPGHWWLAGLVLTVPVAGAAVCVAAAAVGYWPALTWPLAALVLQQVRAALRVDIARRVLPPEPARRSAELVRRGWWLLPFAPLVHLMIWLTSAFGRELSWAGRRYRLLGFGRVEIVAPRP